MINNFKIKQTFLATLFLISFGLLSWIVWDSIRFAKANNDIPVGSVITNKYQAYTLADGACLPDDEFLKLAEALHQGNDWPYERCDDNNFMLPNITDDKGNHIYWIKIR